MIYLLEDEETIAEKTEKYALSVEEIRYTNSQWVSLLMQNEKYKETLMTQLAEAAKRVSEDIRKTFTDVSTPETIEVLTQETQKALEGIEPHKPIDVVYVEFDQSKQKLSFRKEKEKEEMGIEELEEMDKMEVMTFYTESYKNNLISEIADSIIELKEIAQLPSDTEAVLFFLKRFKVEDFSKLTEEKVPLFKTKLKELYDQVEKWKEIDPERYAPVFQDERCVSYPSLDELYELVDLLVHQNHNPPGDAVTSNLNDEEYKVIGYTYRKWVSLFHLCNGRYAKRFIERWAVVVDKETIERKK